MLVSRNAATAARLPRDCAQTTSLETTASRLVHLAVVDALTLTLLALRGEAAERALDLSADVTADHTY
ncbi:hypothetical protein ABT263_35325 [Kitasatospora sp. NPDC001603]|uniref:hypothetical protein n=1 Tax=Kitasatospora sp. NPDC001603 TaxID=3154388 RepID=UPI003326F19F